MTDISTSLFQALTEAEITRYSQFAALCIPFYDYVLTFDNEVEFFWKKKFGCGTVLFLLNRYYTLLAAIVNIVAITTHIMTSHSMKASICLHYFQWFGWGGLITSMIAAVILITRVYALYNLNKKILGVLIVCLFAASSVSAWIIETAISRMSSGNLLTEAGTQDLCNPETLGEHLKFLWMPTLLLDAFLCGLVILQVVKAHHTDAGPLNTSLFNSKRSNLFIVLMRDSVIYFMVTCITYLTCLLFMTLAPPYLVGVPIGYSMVLPSILCGRMMVNIRESHYKRTHGIEISVTRIVELTD